MENAAQNGHDGIHLISFPFMWARNIGDHSQNEHVDNVSSVINLSGPCVTDGFEIW